VARWSDGSQPEATPDQIGEAARALPLQVSLRFIEWVEDGQDSYNTDPAGTAWAFEALYSFCGTPGAGCGHALLGQLEKDYWELQAPLFIGEGLGYAAGGDTLTGDFDGDDATDPTRSEISEAGNAAGDLDELDCGQSFTPATLVLLAGGKTVPIADLRPGDKVLATNVKTGKTQPETVTAVLVNHDHDLYDLTIRSGNKTAVIHTTSNHLFWDPDLNKFLPASNLKPGTHLKTPDGQVAVVVGGSVPADHDGWMWDLTVPGNNDHDFYVAVAATAVLVHNCPTDDGPPSEGTIHSTLRGGAGERNIESGEVIQNAENIYYDENGNQVYRLSQPGGTSQIVIRNPANGNILTNQSSTDIWIEQQIKSGRWYDLQGG
jgi:hypothetical protein